MNVRELIELLQGVEDPDRVVVMSIDSEGNSFNKLESYSERYDFLVASNDVCIRELGPDELDDGFTDEDVCTDGVPALVFWP